MDADFHKSQTETMLSTQLSLKSNEILNKNLEKINLELINKYLNMPSVYVKTSAEGEKDQLYIKTGDLIRDTFVIEVLKKDGTISLFFNYYWV